MRPSSPAPRRAAPAALVALAALCACGGPGSFAGTVDGHRLEVKSAAFAIVDVPQGDVAGAPAGGTAHVAAIVLSDSGNVCGDAEAGALSGGKTYLLLTLVKIDVVSQDFVVPGTGTYAGIDTSNAAAGATLAAATGGVASGYFLAGDGACQNRVPATDASVRSGSVTVSELASHAGGSARGDYKLSMGQQHNGVSGSFDAPYCAAIGALRAALVTGAEVHCR